MSLSGEALNIAFDRLKNLNDHVNELFNELSLPLSNKVQMNHYGSLYLFGKLVNIQTTDDELIEIIQSTPEKSWNGHIDFFGRWIEEDEHRKKGYA